MLPLLAGVLLSIVPQRARADCDVTAADFANTLTLQSTWGELRFRNGSADVFIDEEQRSQHEVEWHYQITSSEIFRPDRFHTVRLLIVSGEHLRGTGTTGEVVAYECAGDEMVETIRAHSAGFTLHKVSEEIFRLISPEWADRDPRSDPSKKRVQVYAWNRRLGRFVVHSDAVMPASTKFDEGKRLESPRRD
jgi:hypothetical protein